MAFSLGGLIRGVGKTIGGAILGGPIGGIVTGIQELGKASSGGYGKTIQQIVTKPILPINLPAPESIGGGTPAPAIIGADRTFTPSSPPSLPRISATGVPIPPGGGGVPGTSIIKQTDVRGAVPSQYSTTAHQGQMGHYTRTGRFIRTYKSGKAIRHINPMNVRAARRAVRRIHAGEKLLRQIFSVTHPGKAKGAHFKPKTKRR